jgi:hypothetical protein
VFVNALARRLPSKGAMLLGSALLILTLLLVLDAIPQSLSTMNGAPWDASLTLAVLLLMGLATLLLGRAFCSFSDERFLDKVALLLVLLSLGLRTAWVTHFGSYQASDFGQYLQCGFWVAETRDPSGSPFCEPVFWRRAMLYTYPLALLFGRSLRALTLSNALLLTFATGLFYAVGKVLYGAQVAVLSLVFFSLEPDLFYAMTLASHDVPGVLGLAVLFALVALLERRLSRPNVPWPSLLALSLALSLTLVFLDFARSYHAFAIAALVLVAIFGPLLGESPLVSPEAPKASGRLRGLVLSALLLVLIPVGTYRVLADAVWARWGRRAPPAESGLLDYVASLDVLGSDNFYEMQSWWQGKVLAVEREYRTTYSKKKLLQDLTHDPVEFLRYLRRKNGVFNRTDGYLFFSTEPAPAWWDTTAPQVRALNNRHVDLQRRAAAIGHAIVLLLVAYRLLLIRSMPIKALEWFPVLLSGLLYAALLLLFESQARYSVFLVFLFSWWAAQGLHHLVTHHARASWPRLAGIPWRAPLGGAILLGLAWAAYCGLARALFDGPLTLRDQSGFEDVPDTALRGARRVSASFVVNNYKQLLLRYPTGAGLEPRSVLAVQRRFSTRSAPPHHLRFFLSTATASSSPYTGKGWEDADIHYLVAVNGRPAAEGRLWDIPSDRYFSLEETNGVGSSPQLTLELVLWNAVAIGEVEESRRPIVALEYVDVS